MEENLYSTLDAVEFTFAIFAFTSKLSVKVSNKRLFCKTVSRHACGDIGHAVCVRATYLSWVRYKNIRIFFGRQ
jgi:hypothetical protein